MNISDHQNDAEAEAEDGEVPELLQLDVGLLECEHAALAAEVVGLASLLDLEGSVRLIDVHAADGVTCQIFSLGLLRVR